MSLINESGNASIENQNAAFLSASFNRFQLNDWVSKSYIQIKFPPLEITTTNKPVIESVLSNQFYHLQ